MSRRIRSLLLALIVALAPVAAHAQSADAGSDRVVAADELVRGDLATIDQAITVLGVVEGDVTSWSGKIVVEGAVRGDVVSYAGAIELGPMAEVGGNVLALGGGVARRGAAQVAGQLLGAEPLAGGQVAASVLGIFSRNAGAPADLPQPLVSMALGLVAMLLSAACALVWPRRTRGVGLALLHAPARALGLGLLTTLLLGLLAMPLGAVLALSLIGLPLLLPLLLALQLPYLFGLAGLGRALAERAGRADLPAAAAVGALAVIAPLVLVGVFAPGWSAALFYLVAGAGLGAALISRGGAYLVPRDAG